MSNTTPLRRRRRGAAAVEFAATFPIVILLALGIVEYGWMFHEYNTVHTALRDAARAGSKAAGGDVTVALATAETRLMENLLHYGLCGPPHTLTSCVDAVAVNNPADSFQVIAAVPYDPITGFAIPGLPSTLNADIVFAIQP